MTAAAAPSVEESWARATLTLDAADSLLDAIRVEMAGPIRSSALEGEVLRDAVNTRDTVSRYQWCTTHTRNVEEADLAADLAAVAYDRMVALASWLSVEVPT